MSKVVSKISSEIAVTQFYYEPAGTSATVVAGLSLDMRDFTNVAFGVGMGEEAGAITKVEVIASTASNLGTPSVVLDSGTININAKTKRFWCEVDSQQIRALGANFRYVGLRITVSNAAATVPIVAVRGPATLHQKAALTATVT